jgi:shikimate kinase
VIYERIKHETHRPLLQTPDPKATIKELLASRETFYAQADMSIDTSNKSIGDIIKAIKERIRHAYC